MEINFGIGFAKYSLMSKRLLILLMFILIAKPSFAEIYKWVDERGIVHFTDDITQIPEKYRRTVEEIRSREDKIENKTEGESQPVKKEDVYRDRLGRGEEYWKGRVEEWRKKLQILHEKVESLRLKYNELTEKFNSSKSSVERVSLRNERENIKNQMDQYRAQIEEAKEMLEKKLPDEAQLYKAKPEWIKP